MPTRTHVPALTPAQLELALFKLDQLAINPAAKRELKAILKAAANPDNDKLETIIKTLPKARQEEIYRIFDEIAAMQAKQAEDGSKALLLLGVLTLGSLIVSYLLPTDQEALQAAQLLNISKRVWIDAIQGEIDYVGGNQRAQGPNGQDLDYLTAKAEEDAHGIVQNFNKDAQRQIEKLYKDNPNGTRGFFIESMKQWAVNRAGWKSLSIAMNTETQTRGYAKRRFAEMNYSPDALYKFTGPPAVCKLCMIQFAAGFVSFQHTVDHATPIHGHCPHSWSITSKPKLDLANLWVG